MFEKIKNIKEQFKKSPEFSDITGSSIKDFINGDIFNKEFIKKQYGVIVLLSVISFFYIGNRYSVEKQLARIDALQRELIEIKYTSLTISCELMTLSRQSNVEAIIQEKNIGLQELVIPPYNIEK